MRKYAILYLSLMQISTSLSLAPVPSQSRIKAVSQLVTNTLNSSHGGSKEERYQSVRESIASAQLNDTPRNELVYGELSIPVLAEILDAVGVEQNDAFLDIGSGDGALVLGAALLYPDLLRIGRGMELVPTLTERSLENAHHLRKNLMVPLEFVVGDVNSQCEEVTSILADSSLAVCFATTWSATNISTKKNSLNGRLLQRLSTSLTRMPIGSRILLIDGRLLETDGYRWEGDMKIECPDTAPYSVASLYERC